MISKEERERDKAVCRAASDAMGRLPDYIFTIEELERRIASVERMAKEVEAGEHRFTHATVKGSQAAMRSVLRILRGAA